MDRSDIFSTRKNRSVFLAYFFTEKCLFLFFFHRFFRVWILGLPSIKFILFSVIFKSSLLNLYPLFHTKKPHCFFLRLPTFLITYSMFAFFFLIAFSGSTGKYRVRTHCAVRTHKILRDNTPKINAFLVVTAF